MLASDLFDQLKQLLGVTKDLDIASLIGVTSGRICQMRASELNPKQVASFIRKAVDRGRKDGQEVLVAAIRPIVEM